MNEKVYEQLLFSKKDAARILGLSPRTLDYLLACKELKATRVGRRVLISRKELENFARRDHPTGSHKLEVRDVNTK